MQPKSIMIDGMLSGTGIRDAVNGGYIEPESLGLSADLRKRLAAWLIEYANAHFADFEDRDKVGLLDEDGIRLARIIQAELKEANVGYYSSAKMCRMVVSD